MIWWWWDLTFRFTDGQLLTNPHVVEGLKEHLSLFRKDMDLILEGSVLMTDCLLSLHLQMHIRILPIHNTRIYIGHKYSLYNNCVTLEGLLPTIQVILQCSSEGPSQYIKKSRKTKKRHKYLKRDKYVNLATEKKNHHKIKRVHKWLQPRGC
jgi:hypothetical protein